MSTPDELERAVKALTDMRDAARDGTPVTDPNEWEFDELTRILAAFQFLLSERAELLATVERMRGALESAAETLYHVDDALMGMAEAGAVPAVGTWRFVTQEAKRARAALTTGEEK